MVFKIKDRQTPLLLIHSTPAVYKIQPRSSNTLTPIHKLQAHRAQGQVQRSYANRGFVAQVKVTPIEYALLCVLLGGLAGADGLPDRSFRAVLNPSGVQPGLVPPLACCMSTYTILLNSCCDLATLSNILALHAGQHKAGRAIWWAPRQAQCASSKVRMHACAVGGSLGVNASLGV